MAHLYAIVGNMERARFMLDGGAPYLQLRFKPSASQPSGVENLFAPHRKEIQGWKAKYPKTLVIVNDDLDEAEKLKVWGVHLGQEDVDRYPPERLRNLGGSRLHLGISTHDDVEVARAKELSADLLGFGPIFPTNTKTLTRPPVGIPGLARAVSLHQHIGNRLEESGLTSLIAIGGIGEDTLDTVADTGVALIAMISYLDRMRSPMELRALMKRILR